jgi:hypothetical protein
MHVLRSFRPVLVTALLVMTWAGSATADETDARARSRALYVEGVAALDDTRPRDALALFEQAYALFPHYSTLYNIGVCYRSLGDHAAAATNFARFLEEGGTEIAAEERAQVGDLLAAEQARVATLTIQVVPRGPLRVDGRAATSGEPVYADPGTHVVEASQSGYIPEHVTVTAVAGERRSLTIGLRAAPPAPLHPTPLRPTPAREQMPAPPERFGLPFWIATGVSGLGFTTFGVFGSMAVVQHNAYDSARSDADAAAHRSRGRDFGYAADAGLVVGLAGAAFAAYLALR